ncbi:hypothetical protein [Burkholderia cepacia]|uniref:hypothetical protein n=1 Tax=Burkholderia cepacia TaxID=292 RepID=UPI001FC8813D|nr:hypothetical protein [Burkholderia cepacia]
MIVAKSDMKVVLPRRLTQHVALSMPVTLVPLPVEVAPFALTMIWHERTHDDPAHDVNTMEVVTYGRTGTTGKYTGRQVSIRNACGRSRPAGANGNDRATRYRHDDRGQRHDGRNAPVAGKAPHKQPGKRLRRVIQQDDDTRRLAVVPRRDDGLPCTAYVRVEHLVEADNQQETGGVHRNRTRHAHREAAGRDRDECDDSKPHTRDLDTRDEQQDRDRRNRARDLQRGMDAAGLPKRAGARLAEDQRGRGTGPDLLDEAQYGTRCGIGEHERLRAHREWAMLAFRQRNERWGICRVVHGPGAGGPVDDTGVRPRV